jgi:hypothetical protein
MRRETEISMGRQADLLGLKFKNRQELARPSCFVESLIDGQATPGTASANFGKKRRARDRDVSFCDLRPLAK